MGNICGFNIKGIFKVFLSFVPKMKVQIGLIIALAAIDLLLEASRGCLFSLYLSQSMRLTCLK